MKKYIFISFITISLLTAFYFVGFQALGQTSTSALTLAIPDGALIRQKGDIDVYIVKYIGNKKFKRLILSPSVFNSYGHLKWENIIDVDKSTIDLFTISDLVRATVAGDTRIYKLYPSGDTGEKRWIKTAEKFNAMGFDWDAVYTINEIDRDSYNEGTPIEQGSETDLLPSPTPTPAPTPISTPSQSWSCGSSITDSRDGKTYATVQIGTQCWMKQSLNVGTMMVGSHRAQGTSCSSIQKSCYKDNEANCNSNNPDYPEMNYPDGALYEWNQAMCGSTTPGVQGICPTGWHIPTDAEFCTLEQTVDPTITCDSIGWRGTDGGTKLRPNGTSGFESNFSGFRDTNGYWWSSNRGNGYFWSSSQSGAESAWSRIISSGSALVHRAGWSNKALGSSIRCLKN